MKYTVNVNEQIPLEIEFAENEMRINSKKIEWDLYQVDEDRYHILFEGKSYRAEVLGIDLQKKEARIKLNDTIYELQLSDESDQMLKKMGFDSVLIRRQKELKAPMPGLVLRILADQGMEIKKGEPLLVLEAMKMENIIRAADDVVIEKTLVKAGDKVDKNQVLMRF